MEDWRLFNEEFFRNIILYKINFPTYWEKSYLTKNDFYHMIYRDAITFVETMHRGEELLQGKEIQKFWHAHCDLCTKKITTENKIECYCTKDYQTWICSTCFNDFKEHFKWSIIPEKE